MQARIIPPRPWQNVAKLCHWLSFQIGVCFLSLVSTSFDHGRHRTPIRQPKYQLHYTAGSPPRTIQQIQRYGPGKQRKNHFQKSNINFLLRHRNPIIPIHGLFSIVDSRSRSQRIPSRQIYWYKPKGPEFERQFHFFSSFYVLQPRNTSCVLSKDLT